MRVTQKESPFKMFASSFRNHDMKITTNIIKKDVFKESETLIFINVSYGLSFRVNLHHLNDSSLYIDNYKEKEVKTF